MTGKLGKMATVAVLALFLTNAAPAMSAADKVKEDAGYDVRLSSSSIELVFPDGSILSTPLNFDGKSIEQVDASGGMAQELLNEAYGQLGLNKTAYLPKAFSLAQNYPNPFNPSTTISYAIPEDNGQTVVRLSIFSLRGQLVRTLVDKNQGPGTYNVNWDGRDDRGRQISSGVYFYRLVANDFVSTRKMVVLK
jgi:hypothetical protein